MRHWRRVASESGMGGTHFIKKYPADRPGAVATSRDADELRRAGGERERIRKRGPAAMPSLNWVRMFVASPHERDARRWIQLGRGEGPHHRSAVTCRLIVAAPAEADLREAFVGMNSALRNWALIFYAAGKQRSNRLLFAVPLEVAEVAFVFPVGPRHAVGFHSGNSTRKKAGKLHGPLHGVPVWPIRHSLGDGGRPGSTCTPAAVTASPRYSVS